MALPSVGNFQLARVDLFEAALHGTIGPCMALPSVGNFQLARADLFEALWRCRLTLGLLVAINNVSNPLM